MLRGALLSLLAVTLASAMHNPKFASKSRALLSVPNSTAAVAAAVAMPSTCVPDGSVLLSMSNKHHSGLRQLQFQRVAHLPCLMQRLVSICWGNFTNIFGVCVRGGCDGGLGSACLASDYRRSQYVALNWAKWPFFIDALQAASQILWIEADVVISTNPFSLLSSLPVAVLGADVVYQWELPPCDLEARTPLASSAHPGVACTRTVVPHEEPLNCGQLLIRSSAFAHSVWASRPEHVSNGAKSQQHYANVVKNNYTHAGLPLEYFNHCWQTVPARAARIVDPCRVVTFHATCGLNSRDKTGLMKKFLNSVNHCPL